jgi:hypothetical protein
LYHDVHLKIFCIGDVLGGDLSNSLIWDLVLSLNDDATSYELEK